MRNPIRRAVILALGRFVRGQFRDILDMDIAAEPTQEGSESDYATDLLLLKIQSGLTLQAGFGLGLSEPEAIFAAEAAFAEVRRLSVDATRSEIAADAPALSALSIFAGRTT